MGLSTALKQLQSGRWSYICMLLLCSSLFQACKAYDMTHADVSNTSYYQELAKKNALVVDGLHAQTLERRTNTSGENETTTLNTNTGLPVPFDTSLGSNFTQEACPQYFAKFLADSTFLSCLPLSLLLQNSMSFFQAARSPSLLEKTLETSCAASLAVCSPLMDKFASDLISAENCQEDYQRENPLVIQAYSGLMAYEPLYQATCLKDKQTNKYCFLEAMDSNNADDAYPYYTAVGLQLPTGSQPTCSSCLKQTMGIFSGYAVQKDQPVSQTYLNCATQINGVCGQGFASTQVKTASKVASGGDVKQVSKSLRLIASLFILVSCFIWFTKWPPRNILFVTIAACLAFCENFIIAGTLIKLWDADERIWI